MAQKSEGRRSQGGDQDRMIKRSLVFSIKYDIGRVLKRGMEKYG